MTRIEAAVRTAERALIPPPKLRMSEWIEAEVEIPEGVSKLPGKLRLSPLQREIADAIGDRSIERVTMVKPVRVGFTTLVTATIAGFVANDPTAIMVVLPTEDDCRGYMVDDVEPIFGATAAVANVLSDDQPEGERNTILSRRFPGGSLKVKAGKSPRNLRRHNVDVLYLDELDGMEVTNEGPVDVIAEKRTFNSPDRKIIKGSTPVDLDTSAILRAYAQSDQRVFEVPCPECGDFHEILWGDIRWRTDPDGTHHPETAYWCCPSCGSVVEERHKAGMVDAGRFRATKPEVKGHAGFRANALISTQANAAWGKLAAEFLAARDDPTTLQVFVNTILGQGWRGAGDEIDDAALMERAEDWGLEAVPEDCLEITAGVDVQHDRLEVTLWGWGEDGTEFALGHEVLWGDWDDADTWTGLDQFLARGFPHALGGRIGISASAVDSGDGTTSKAVVAFCRARSRRRIMAIKGEDGFRRPLIERSRSKGQDRLFIVGADTGKAQLFARAARPGAIRFSKALPGVWFEQFAAERAVTKYVRGVPTKRFERIPGRRAEALDCAVYARAARQVLVIDWAQRRAELAVSDPATVRPAPAPRNGNDWFGTERKGWF